MDQLSPAQSEAIAEALKSGRKVAAVKLYREFTGKGLAESKESVEQNRKTARYPGIIEHFEISHSERPGPGANGTHTGKADLGPLRDSGQKEDRGN